MSYFNFIRLFPFLLSAGLLLSAFFIWPAGDEGGGKQAILAWINVILTLLLAAISMHYGIRLLRERNERRPGSRLRAKLVIGLVCMLLIPTFVLQLSANQMVERGMDVWFDIRVDGLLDRALNLAQGFYSRVESDLKQGMLLYGNDSELLQALHGQPNYALLGIRLAKIRKQENWQRLQLFDTHGRLLAGVQERGLASLKAEALGENARLAVALGRVVTGLTVTKNGGEVAVGYIPLWGQRGVEGLLRAEVTLPMGVVTSAREVESDYRSYRELERNRQALSSLFMHTMWIITLLVVLITGLAALLFARRLTSPIGDLAEALHKVTEGDLQVSISVAPHDELGSLVHSFNRMTARLNENVQALEETRHDLTNALDSSHQRQRILETLLSNLQTGVLLLDAEGKIRLLNQAVSSLLMLTSDWQPGQEASVLCHGKLQAVGNFLNELLHQDQDQLQRELELSHDKQLHLLMRGIRFNYHEGDGMSGYIVVLDDVSSLAETQRHRAWSEVARRMAHEIKNPLTPIKLAAERLQRRFRKDVADVGVFDSCTHVVIEQVERLQRLVTDFSTLARLPKPRIQQVDMRALMLEMHDLYASYERIDVRVPHQTLAAKCDADQMKQVLINLIDNALAATAKHEEAVRLYVEKNHEMISFHLQDDGEGIDQTISEHLFEPYYSTKVDGSGLGLAIAKRIAEEHAGELVLISLAKPTHFILQFPYDLIEPVSCK
ncbi:MAG: ATP-binding protein [Mariprofundaceae bacterium]